MGKKLSLSVMMVVLLIGLFLVFNKYMADLDSNIKVTPIEHATMVLRWGDKVIYTDPVGEVALFANQPAPDLILLTDVHSDHLSVETLEAISKENTIIVAPSAVADMLPNKIPGALLVMKNGQKTNHQTEQKINLQGFSIEAIPMYNLPEKTDSYHPKGRGNGYVVEADGKRVYLSGDTADIPELRQLKDVDLAFVSMNLPYTMSVEKAAEAVLVFKPKQVYPYHYRGEDGLSDVAKFKALVNQGDPNIQVMLVDWYPR